MFEKKSERFSNFIDVIWDKWSDFRIDPEEVKELQTQFYRDVYIYLSPERLERIACLFSELEPYIGKEIPDSEIGKPRNSLFKIINILKAEIGLREVGDNELKTLDKIDDAFRRLSKVTMNLEVESIVEDGKFNRTFWHFIAFDYAHQKQLIENQSTLVLGDSESEGPSKSNLIKQISKGDIIFLYGRGHGYVGCFEAIESGCYIPKNSGLRIFMNENDGHEGQVKVKSHIFLTGSAKVPRNVPRLKTLQRIYDKNAIKKLLTECMLKAETINTDSRELLKTIIEKIAP